MSTSRFVRACLRLPVDRTPIWFLRQAGRYMPEYMAVRKHHSLLDICRTPDIAAEVTITAAERLGVDAAIIFADLLLPLTPMGLDFDFIANEGPRVQTPIRTLAQVQALRTDRTDDLQYVARAIEKVIAHFSAPRPPEAGQTEGDQLGIIGFCGAPFTLASYMIEGGGSRNYIEAKKLMYASGAGAPRLAPDTPAQPTSDPGAPRLASETWAQPTSDPGAPRLASETWAQSTSNSAAWPLLMDKLVTVLTAFAAQQVAAGADVIQVFDSWAGALSVEDYRQFCLEPTTRLVQNIRALGVPVIYFGVDTASLLPTMKETGADVLGLDWRTPLDHARITLGDAVAVQGNLDPITLFAPEEVIESRVKTILQQAARRPGHIFNLGHGIVPGTPVENVLKVVQWVKQYG